MDLVWKTHGMRLRIACHDSFMSAFDGAHSARKADNAPGAESRKPLSERLISGARLLGQGMVELAWPTRCVCCDLPGTLLCDDCRESLPRIDSESACPCCGAPYGRLCCTECWSADGKVELPFDSAVAALEFTAASSRLILSMKDHGERRLVPIIAELMDEALDEGLLRAFDLMTFVPATAAAVLRRGFDHMELIARELSRITGLECVRLLEPRQSVDQRSLSRVQRVENMDGAFTCCDTARVEGKRVLLIDDVFTTGATLFAASTALLEGGAESVGVETLYRVW